MQAVDSMCRKKSNKAKLGWLAEYFCAINGLKQAKFKTRLSRKLMMPFVRLNYGISTMCTLPISLFCVSVFAFFLILASKCFKILSKKNKGIHLIFRKSHGSWLSSFGEPVLYEIFGYAKLMCSEHWTPKHQLDENKYFIWNNGHKC